MSVSHLKESLCGAIIHWFSCLPLFNAFCQLAVKRVKHGHEVGILLLLCICYMISNGWMGMDGDGWGWMGMDGDGWYHCTCIVGASSGLHVIAHVQI